MQRHRLVEIPNRFRRRPSFAPAWQVRQLRITTGIPDLSEKEWAGCQHAALLIHRVNGESRVVLAERMLRVTQLGLGEFEVRITSEEELEAETRQALEEAIAEMASGSARSPGAIRPRPNREPEGLQAEP